jgi:hypothetical protein
VNDDIQLNGTATDPDGPHLTTLWTIDNSNCVFADPTNPSTTVNCSVTGTFAATLTANDGVNLPVTDTAVVTVVPPPPGLTVHAGPAGSGQTGQPIHLTGKITDPSHSFTSLWSSDSPNCTFFDPTMVVTTITCTAPGVYAATLTGHDGFNPDASDTTLVSVNTPNLPPTVNAGGNVTGAKNTAIPLHGTATDSDGDTLTITWSSDTPTCTFGNIHAADTTITCPNTGTVAATLTAKDPVNPAVSDTAIVTVVGNIPPTVSAGPDVQTAVGFPVQLNGTVSDPDSTPTVQWSTGSPNCSFTDPTSAVTMITCSAAGVVAATLTASDGVNTPVSDTALVTVIAPNDPPIVNAGIDGNGTIHHPVALNGAAFDPDGDTVAVHWSNGNPNCSFANPNVAVTTMTCSVPGIFAATLTANDGVLPPVSDTALITFTNPACPQTEVCVNIGDAMTYEGGSLYLPITITQPQPVAVTVNVKILPTSVTNTAVNGYGKPSTFVSDFKSATLHNIKIAANARVAYLTVTGIQDNIPDGDKQLQAQITGATAATLPTPTPVNLGRVIGTGIIKDTFINTGTVANPVYAPIPPDQLLIGSESIVETNQCATCRTTAKFSVLVNDPGGKTDMALTAKYATVNGPPSTAIPNVDYTPKNPTTLSWTALTAIQKAVTVTILGDPNPDATEDLNIQFSLPSIPTLFGQGSVGHIFILDND